MAATAKVGKINVPDNQIDPVVQSIMDDLLQRKLSKKEIANKHKVELGVVCRISKRYNLGAKVVSIQQIQDSVEITNEDDKEKTNMDENNVYQKPEGPLSGKREKLPDDIIIDIISDLEEGSLSKQKIADKHNVSISSVYRYAQEFGLITPGKRGGKGTSKKSSSKKTKTTKTKKQRTKTQKEKKVVPIQKKEENSSNLVVCKRESLEVGMIKDRHNMPDHINTYIFDSPVDENIMFSYPTLDCIVYEFLLSNIKVTKDANGDFVGDKDLIVYVTGLTCCLASVIKMCRINNINLTLMHFNNKTRGYEPQVIWNEFGKTKLESLVSGFSTASLIKCKFEDLNQDNFYTIKVINFSSKDKNNREIDLYIFAKEIDLWEFHSDLLKNIMNDKTVRKTIFVEESSIKDDSIVFEKRISQSCNFKSIINSR